MKDLGLFAMKRDRNVCPYYACAAVWVLRIVAALPSGCASHTSPRIDGRAVLKAEEAAVVQLGHIEAAAFQQGAVKIVAPELQDSLQELVDELAVAADCPVRCRVHVVNSRAINAFALPTGNIFVLSGTLRVTENRDQLAAVLGHEIAHVIHKDALRKLQHRSAEEERAAVTAALLGAVLSGTASGAVSGALGPVLGGMNPHLANAIQRHVFSIPCDLAARLAASLPGPMVRSLLLLSIETYSQETEFRADRYGLVYAGEAGYDRKAGAEFLAKWAEILERGAEEQEGGR